MDFRELLRQISGPALPPAVPRAMRFLTSPFAAASEEEAAPGLIQKPDGTVWIVNPDGSLVPLGGSQPLTSPLDLTGCVLWIDASQLEGLNDGDDVTTWPDLSTSGYNFAQDGANDVPVYKTAIQNNLPVVRFDGSMAAQYLKLSGAGLGLFRNLAALTVAGVSGNLNGNGNDYMLEAMSGTDGTVPRVTFETAVNFTVSDDDSNPGVTSLSANAFAPDTVLTAAVFAADLRLGIAAVDGAPGGFGNSARATTWVPNNPATPDTDSLAIFLGAVPPDGNSGKAEADLGELVVYNRALNRSEQRQLTDYLAAKWGTL